MKLLACGWMMILTLILFTSTAYTDHLVPVYETNQYIFRFLTMHDTLDTFSRFYINKYVDYHAFEIAF